MKIYLKNILTGIVIGLVGLITLWSLETKAIELDYSIGVSQSMLEHKWYGASQATFEFDLTTVRVSAEHESGWGVRYGYGLPMGKDTQTTITNQTFAIDFKKYQEFELLYNFDLVNDFGAYVGIGHYMQTLPIHRPSGEMIRYDEDNDSGFFGGINYNMDSVSIEIFFKQTGSIGSRGGCDQECIDNWEAKGSTIRQIGVGLYYTF